jgi:hypothetical protein
MSIEALKEKLPEYARDQRLNLAALVMDTLLSEQQRWGTLRRDGARLAQSQSHRRDRQRGERWRNSRRDGAGTTRAFHCASSTLRVIWTRSANSHTGRRLCSCRIEGRTDDSIRPRATTIPTFSLA